MKIVAIDPILIFLEHKTVLESLGEVKFYDDIPKDQDELFRRVNEGDIVINFWTDIRSNVISKLTKTKLIISSASGYDWIDYNTALEKKILVAHCPGHNAEAVAEHTVGLILAAIRKSFDAAFLLKQGKEVNLDHFQGFELKGKTLGVIGFGGIGKRVAEIAEKGLGMKILSINSKSTRDDLEELLKNSDVISVNAPLNDSTKLLLGKKEFSLMKPKVIFVNTGRGGIVDEEALVENLENGKVFAAGLDTIQDEKHFHKNPFQKFSNVIVTPHMAWRTAETDFRMSEQVVEIVKSFIEGKPKFIIPEHKSLL